MWPRRLLSLALFVLLCALAAYWVMLLRAPVPAIVPSTAALPPAPVLDASLHARLFGGAVAANPMSNIRVAGVVAPSRDDAPGIALLAIDDRPARAFSTGDTVADGTVLREVHVDRVVVDQGGSLAELGVPQALRGTASAQGGTPPPGTAAAQPGAGARTLPSAQVPPPSGPRPLPQR